MIEYAQTSIIVHDDEDVLCILILYFLKLLDIYGTRN